MTNPMMQRPGEDKERQVTYKKVVYERVKVNFTGGRDRYVTHNLKTQTLTVEITGPDGTAYESDVQVISDNRIAIRTRENVSNATLKITGSVPKRATDWDLLKDNAIRIVMGLRDVSVYYTQNGSTVLPGYTEDTRFLGIKAGAPGLPFVLGWQDELFADKAARRGWLTQDTSLIQEYGLTMARTLNLRATYIPFNGLTIQLRGSRTMAQHQTAYFVFENGTYPEAYRNPVKSGSFSISVVSLKTSFESPKASNGYRSEAFDRFVAYRSTIAERRAEAMHRTDPSYDRTAYSGDGGTNGYGLLSQDVLIPAFFAAYTGRSPHRVSLSYFPSLTSLRPNWDLSWDGLRDLSGFLEKKLKSINIRHAYSSLYSIGNYTSNADFVDVRSAVSRARDMQYNFIPEYDIATVSIAEQYTPLIGVDFTTESNVSARFEVRKSRTVTLSLTNLQISENQNNETVMSLGYTFDHIPVFLRNLSGTVRSVDTQLVVDADLSVRDTKSFIRRIAEVPQASSGQRVVTLGMAARYVMNQNLTMRVFYDRVVNDPFVSSSYRTSNSSFGFSLQFLLTE